MGRQRRASAASKNLSETGIRSPCLSDPKEQHADWLELCALRECDRNASLSDLMAALNVSGSYDALIPPEEVDEEYVPSGAGVIEEGQETGDAFQSEAAADAAFLEVSERLAACGNSETYPFDVGQNHVALRDDTEQSVYVFLLLLSTFGHDAGPKKEEGAKLFEEVCARAAEAYLGGSLANSMVFGFPRRVGPAGFGPAVDDLCRTMGEGRGHRERPTSKDQKDAKLDVVAWRGFPDGRPGKLIAFGQCATGDHWRDKLTELQPGDWCRFWMQETPAALPIRLFFIPHRIEQEEWLHTCSLGGILLERCRISHLVRSPSPDLSSRLARWSRFVLDQALRAEDVMNFQ
jgi:hypothetical protein